MDKQSALKADFRNFLGYCWRYLDLPEPTPIQDEIADYLQLKGQHHKIIEGYRGVGKSWATSVYVLWKLWKDPQLKFLVASASKDRANDFSAFTFRLINEIPILRHLRPLPNQRSSMLAFDVGPARAAHAPSVKSRGIFGQLTGSRANEIVADDIEVPNNSLTADMREKLLKAVGEFEGIILPGGRITYLGTPQTEESIYGKLQERGYAARMWPSQVPKEEDLDAYTGALAPSIEARSLAGEAGQATDPRRFDVPELDARRARWGRSAYELQYMLNTSLSDANRYPLKTSDLIVMSVNPEKAPLTIAWASGKEQQLENLPGIGFSGDRFYKPMWHDESWDKYTRSLMAIDPSGRGEDETAFVILKYLHGYLYLVKAGGFKGGYTDSTLKQLAHEAKVNSVNEIVIEANYGGGMFAKLFRPILYRRHQCKIEEVWHSKQKELRIIDTLEPVLNQHKLIVCDSVVKADVRPEEFAKRPELMNYSLFYQLTRITKDKNSLKHDDKLDVLALAVEYWIEGMGMDDKDALREWKARVTEETYDENRKVILGKPVEKAPCWVDTH
jgi:hypothetical protein